LIEPAVRALGSERFCFSADMSYVASMGTGPPPLLAAIRSSSLSGQAQADLLGGSLRRLFGARLQAEA
jgi:hypothetical protein